MSLNTPVVLLIFNRPEPTKRVFDTIRQAKPQKLFVVADGARFPEESEKCQQARAIIDRVDWNCEVLTNFSEINLGSKKRVSSGINWVFSQVEEAIILEDDCLPAPSFFSFCQTLLERYREDRRVMHISGNNFQSGQSRTPHSYYFSKYTHIWGWATWKRAWQHHEVEMPSWLESKQLDLLDSFYGDCDEREYWTKIFDRVHNNEIDTCWDYQWLYSCWLQNGLSILPDCNLVSNIGFNEDATHTKSPDSPFANLPVTDIWEIKHPDYITRHDKADQYTFEHHFGGLKMRQNRKINRRIKRKASILKYKAKSYFHRLSASENNCAI